MKTETIDTYKKVARIFEDVGRFYICDDSLPYLDTRGRAYRSRREAIQALREAATYEVGPDRYTHYLAGGRVRKIGGAK